MRKIVIGILLALTLLPTYKIFADSPNVGFVAGNIWYSKDPFEEGDKIRVYTLIFNGDKRELLGTVGFYDKDTLIDEKDFTIAPETAKDIYVSWTVKAGNHSITAKISNARFLISSGKYEKASLVETESKESVRTVETKVTQKSDTQASSSNTNSTNTNSSASIQNVEKAIIDNTPTSVSKPIVAAVSALENARENVSTVLDTNKAQVKKDIDLLEKDPNADLSQVSAPTKEPTTNKKDTTKASPKNEQKSGDKITYLKPFKYIELFFLTIFSFIFGHIIVFYIVLLILIFLILRYIWRKFF